MCICKTWHSKPDTGFSSVTVHSVSQERIQEDGKVQGRQEEESLLS